MTILFLEDNPSTFFDKKELLIEAGFDVIACTRVDQANERLIERIDDIACIVTDLNMPASWLPQEIQLETDGAVFTGWVWLYRQVYPQKIISTVIYSEFARTLERRFRDLSALEATTEEVEYMRRISGKIEFFSKRDTVRDGFGIVIDAVRRLTKEGVSCAKK